MEESVNVADLRINTVASASGAVVAKKNHPTATSSFTPRDAPKAADHNKSSAQANAQMSSLVSY